MTSLAAPSSAASKFDLRWLIGRIGPLIGLLFVFALFSILVQVVPDASRFATLDNMQLILRQTAVVGIASLGMTLIIISGGIDLSVGSTLALCTVVIGLVLRSHEGLAPNRAALMGIAAAAGVGLLIGIMVTVLRLSPFIATLGLWGALRGLAEGMAGNNRFVPSPENNPRAWEITWLHGLTDTLRNPSPIATGGPLSWEWPKWLLLPPGVWLMLILAVVVWATLRYTRFGRHVFAIGSNEQTARLCGVPIIRTKILIYLIAGILVGIAGILEFSYISSGDPTDSMGAELNVIAAVVIGGASLSGGQGSVLGSLIGALIMTMVGNGCTKLPAVETYVQKIATGIIIILAVLLDQLRHRRST
jgi:ribose transport system permease protein